MSQFFLNQTLSYAVTLMDHPANGLIWIGLNIFDRRSSYFHEALYNLLFLYTVVYILLDKYAPQHRRRYKQFIFENLVVFCVVLVLVGLVDSIVVRGDWKTPLRIAYCTVGAARGEAYVMVLTARPKRQLCLFAVL
ncbi:hypothetical protein MMC10_004044 [Thelotrema lepadinum]|nr:hypothetical protein [Thelotrema lepadinum]